MSLGAWQKYALLNNLAAEDGFEFSGKYGLRSFQTNCYYFFSAGRGMGWKNRAPDKLLLLFWRGRGGAYAGLEGPPEAVVALATMEAGAGTLESREKKA